MSRALILLAGLTLGLLAAALAEGRMAHLRLLLGPERLPAWTGQVTDASGLLRGRTRPLSAGPARELRIAWRFAGLGASGAAWRLRADGPGLSAEADLRLRAAQGELALSDGRGTAILGGAALPGPGGLALGGRLEIARLEGRFDPFEGRLLSVRADALWREARLDGRPAGEGRVALVSDAGGRWRAPFSLSGGPAEVEGRLEGRFDSGEATLEAAIAPGPDMPRDWRRLLDLAASPEETGWRLRRRIALPAGGAGF